MKKAMEEVPKKKYQTCGNISLLHDQTCHTTGIVAELAKKADDVKQRIFVVEVCKPEFE